MVPPKPPTPVVVATVDAPPAPVATELVVPVAVEAPPAPVATELVALDPVAPPMPVDDDDEVLGPVVDEAAIEVELVVPAVGPVVAADGPVVPVAAVDPVAGVPLVTVPLPVVPVASCARTGSA